MRVFLDANILFSAALSKSRLRPFLQQLGRRVQLLTNAYAQEEAARNLAAKHPERLGEHKKFASSLEEVSGRLFELGVPLAKKDQPILCGAIAGRADYLLTGDKKDFGSLFGRTVQGVKVVTVEMLMEELEERGMVELQEEEGQSGPAGVPDED